MGILAIYGATNLTLDIAIIVKLSESFFLNQNHTKFEADSSQFMGTKWVKKWVKKEKICIGDTHKFDPHRSQTSWAFTHRIVRRLICCYFGKDKRKIEEKSPSSVN